MCINGILTDIPENTSFNASSIPDIISDIDPDGALNLYFTFNRISIILLYDSELRFSAYNLKPDIESIIAITISYSGLLLHLSGVHNC